MPRRSPLQGVTPASLAYRPKSASRARRDRSWDRAQRADPDTCQISLRGVPRRVNRRMKEIAAAEGITVSQVAVQLLEFALAAYDARLRIRSESQGAEAESTAPLAAENGAR
jgi:hypothetical protein